MHHARQQMFERGVDEEQIKIAMQRGAKIKQTDGYLAIYSYIRIAYRIVGKDIYKIKTVVME